MTNYKEILRLKDLGFSNQEVAVAAGCRLWAKHSYSYHAESQVR